VSTGERNQTSSGENDMSWKTPKIVEIALGAEINSYACAEARK
jgi:coenzyme PQQ precursor peptide PqqA